MSLRILFADDSVTAQNMGRKILTEAGYEVVAVSNGAAAVKKIAEQKPDIIILDVYMPGYSGLEVCEKVRGSMETMKTPVLLTVGKMEPYRPEDGNRVKADGVIVKPFEASDLLAIVKKFGERVAQKPAVIAQPVLVERFQEEIVEEPLELPVEPMHASTVAQPMVEVPDHMATSSAFSDLLGTESTVSENHFSPAPAPPVQETPTPSISVPSAIPEYELPVSWREQEPVEEKIPAPAVAASPVPFRAGSAPVPFRAAADPAPFSAAVEPAAFRATAEPAPVQTAAEPQPELEPAPRPTGSRPLQIPVYQDQEPGADPFEFVPTAAPATGEIEIPKEPALLESAADATRNTVAEETEPGLLSTGQQFESTPVDTTAAELAPVEEHFIPAGFQDIPAEIAAHLPPPVVEAAPVAAPEPPAVDSLSDNDFEARVAAALAAYSHAQEAPAVSNKPPVDGFVAPPPDALHEAPAPIPDAIPEVVEADAEIVVPAEEAPASFAEQIVAAEPAEVATQAGDAAPEIALPEEEPAGLAEFSAPVLELHSSMQSPPEAPVAEAPVPEALAPEPVETTSFAPIAKQEAVPAAIATEPAAVQAPPAPVARASEHAASEPLVAEAVAGPEVPEPHAAAIDSALPAVTAAAAAAAANSTGADHHTISQAVHRVMERLKPELVEEILRELKSKKD